MVGENGEVPWRVETKWIDQPNRITYLCAEKVQQRSCAHYIGLICCIQAKGLSVSPRWCRHCQSFIQTNLRWYIAVSRRLYRELAAWCVFQCPQGLNILHQLLYSLSFGDIELSAVWLATSRQTYTPRWSTWFNTNYSITSRLHCVGY
jgi:hypothetical protein